jgi:ATP adenylyltransferase
VISDTGSDRGNYVLARYGGCVALLNRYPYTNGHLMIMPERHVSSFNDLSVEEAGAMHELLRVAESALLELMGAEGINGGWNLGRCAGAGIEGHLHLHVLPRWSGDTNFMTAVGGTRVISQSLEDAFDILAPAFSPSRLPHTARDEKVAEQ